MYSIREPQPDITDKSVRVSPTITITATDITIAATKLASVILSRKNWSQIKSARPTTQHHYHFEKLHS